MSYSKLQYISKQKRLERIKTVKRFSYNPNGDNLGFDSLSHDEVIKIGSEFIATKETMQEILVNKFPIMLIDESQDTKKELIDALLCVYENHKNWAVGMFGDISEFLADDRFIGVKHTSSDYFALEQFKAAFPNKLVYNGYDEMFLAGLAMGADGGIGSTYNFMADKFIKMQELFAQDKLSEAQKLQKEANIIIQALCKVGVMQGEKAIMDAMGFNFGPARAPFAPLSDEQKKELVETILPLL